MKHLIILSALLLSAGPALAGNPVGPQAKPTVWPVPPVRKKHKSPKLTKKGWPVGPPGGHAKQKDPTIKPQVWPVGPPGKPQGNPIGPHAKPDATLK